MTKKKKKKINDNAVNDITFSSFLLYQGYRLGEMDYDPTQKSPVYFSFYKEDNCGEPLSKLEMMHNLRLFKRKDSIEFFIRYAECMRYLIFYEQGMIESEARRRKEYKEYERHYEN